MNRMKFFLLLFVSGTLVVSCQKTSEETADTAGSDPSGSVAVELARLEPTTFTEYGEYYGEILGIREVRLQTFISGRVNELKAAVGEPVKAGQSLASIDGEKAESQFRTARYSEELARDNVERQRNFIQKGFSYQVALQEAELAHLQARTALLEAQRARDAALAISPIDGVVVRRHVELYQELGSEEPTFTVADLSRMKVTVGIPESDIAGIRRLTEAEIRVASFPGRSWKGVPVSYSRKSSDRTQSFDVEIEIPNDDGALLSGLTARVRLALRRYEDAIVVPSEAVMTRGVRNYVFVVRDDRATERFVILGPADERQVMIREGLAPGERIIVRGINQVEDGKPIRDAASRS